tara:strand:- start:1579 stop:1776 length:198 start_codon:yes stop_codon:yes gene_type:complete
MALKKHTLIKKFENQNPGDIVMIHESQETYFVENGYIEIKGKKKKTKTKAKIEDENTTSKKEINN